MKPIDLRSDTVTQPDQAMKEAMMTAPLGDDVLGDDPTVQRLEALAAGRLGKEAALFVPSGTMGNQIAIHLLTRPGDEVLVEASSHIYLYEAGAPAFVSGVQLRPIPGRGGVFTAAQAGAALNPDDAHFARSALIAVENTHNKAGGTIFPLEEIQRLRELADNAGLAMHLDGARLFNAEVATGIPAREYARHFETVSFCLSKGLGAPVGSVLCSSRERIHQARRVRKKLGGGMRQAGLLAAAGIYALENNIERLRDDHAKAQILARTIRLCEQFELAEVATNIVLFRTREPQARQLEQLFRDHGIWLMALDDYSLRAVTHLDVSFAQVEQAAEFFLRHLM